MGTVVAYLFDPSLPGGRIAQEVFRNITKM
jgi:hypothetical protein